MQTMERLGEKPEKIMLSDKQLKPLDKDMSSTTSVANRNRAKLRFTTQSAKIANKIAKSTCIALGFYVM